MTLANRAGWVLSIILTILLAVPYVLIVFVLWGADGVRDLWKRKFSFHFKPGVPEGSSVNLIFTRAEFWIIIAALAVLALGIGYDIAMHGSRLALAIVKHLYKVECD